MVTCLLFKSLSHFEFIFVYGMRECYNYIDLHAAVQHSHYHLETIFSPLCSLASFVEDHLSVGMWVVFFPWILYSVPLTHMSVFVPAPLF